MWQNIFQLKLSYDKFMVICLEANSFATEVIPQPDVIY